MTKISEFLKTRGFGYYVTLPAAIFAVAAALSYEKTGVTEFSPNLDGMVATACYVGAALFLVSFVLDYKPVRYAGYLAVLFAFMKYVATQVTYIANVLVSIDATTISDGMKRTMLFFGAAILLGLIGAITSHAGQKKEESV
ncbi:MAG: hypothetical protein IJ773_12410 [Lachnospiraceae bacterium]|nr:hypothetical protein [Lachnospiraceae bacterium]